MSVKNSKQVSVPSEVSSQDNLLQHPKVSVVMPVYNAGKYLRPCVESILQQSLIDFELIMVLDCPTDGSDKVAEQLAQEDERIVLISNSHNLHIGQSRNVALRRAKGDYIAFADHDDKVFPTWLETLYTCAVKSEADIVVSNFIRQTPTQQLLYQIPHASPSSLQKGMLEAMICSRHIMANTCGYHNANTIWNLLYKRSFLQQNALEFLDNNVISCEDALFNIHAFMHAQKVVHVNQALYIHMEYSSNTYDSYVYLSYPHTLSTLQAIVTMVQGNDTIPLAWIGEAVMRRLYVCLFHEYHHKGCLRAWHLLCQWHHHPAFATYLKAYQPLATGLSFPKRCFLRWIA